MASMERTLENPKGKLLEFCARTKALPPTLVVERSGERWGVALTLVVHDRTLESAMHWAQTRVSAEQLAAGELLGVLALTSEAEPGELVTDDEEAALRLQNPKGKLFERCVGLRVTPVFDVHPVLTSDGNGFEASVSVLLPSGEELWSDIRRAGSAKAAEQAAAASLLPQVISAATPGPSSAVSPPPSAATDARSALNELRMRGGLRDYGFVLERQDGPQHAPVFFVKAFAIHRSGERVEVPSVTASSKKEAERLAAERLFQELHGPRRPSRRS
jgi:dsRNA-specific ribonuclease